MRNLFLLTLCVLSFVSTGCTAEARARWAENPTGQIERLESGRARSSTRGSYRHRDITRGEILGARVAAETTEYNIVTTKDGQTTRYHGWDYDVRTYGARGGVRVRGKFKWGDEPKTYDEKDANGHARGDSRYTYKKPEDKRDRNRDRNRRDHEDDRRDRDDDRNKEKKKKDEKSRDR